MASYNTQNGGNEEKMSTPPPVEPVLGRDARLFKDGSEIGHGKNISTKASAEIIKVRSMDSLQPVITAPGAQSFAWSMERLFTGPDWIKLLLAGTKFDLVFAPEGDDSGDTIETWVNCSVTNREAKAGESDGVLENISGEAENVTFPSQQ
jgi:hypothetical protein